MFLNNTDINIFGASVSKKLIQPTSVEVEKHRNGTSIKKVGSKKSFKQVYIKLLFQGANRDIINKNISDFMAKLSDEADIRFKDITNSFHVFLELSSIEDTDFDDWLYLILNLEAYEYGQEICEVMNRVTSKVINVKGNDKAAAIVEITPSVDIIDLKLTGLNDETIEIKNLKANKKVIIGEDLVTVDGENKFNDTVMWEFPELNPGANTITCSRSNVDINIKYKPRFI